MLHINTYIHLFAISRRIILKMKNVSDKSRTENHNPLLMFSEFIPLENRVVCEKMGGKICGAEQVTDDGMTYAQCILDT